MDGLQRRRWRVAARDTNASSAISGCSRGRGEPADQRQLVKGNEGFITAVTLRT